MGINCGVREEEYLFRFFWTNDNREDVILSVLAPNEELANAHAFLKLYREHKLLPECVLYIPRVKWEYYPTQP